MYKGSEVLRKKRKRNATTYISDAGAVISYVAQGMLKNSRKVRKDHVIWNPDEQRSREGDKHRNSLQSEGGTFVSYT